MVEGSRGTWLGFKEARFRKRSRAAVVWAVLLIRCAKPQPQSRAWAICSHGASACPALPSALLALQLTPGQLLLQLYPVCKQSYTPFHLLHSTYILRKTWQHVWCAHEFLLPQIPSRSDNAERLCLFDNSVSLHLLWHSIFQLKYLRVSKNTCMF